MEAAAAAAASPLGGAAGGLDLSTLMGGSESATLPSLYTTSYLTALIEAWRTDPRALWSSFAMIIVSEIGDKTFLIAAILAMRQSKIVVFSGAFASLAVMSVLSALLGVMFPSLLPKSVTNLLAAGLFLVFGVKMLRDGLKMTGEEIKEEWEEAEREIEEEEGGHELDELEQGSAAIGGGGESSDQSSFLKPTNGSAPHHKPTSSGSGVSNKLREGTKNLCGLCFSPVFAQAFILTFLGEWGDRSQIATIALAAAHNVTLVCIGTIVGHACCTTLAVLGGSWLASKISVRHVTLGGAVLFLIFGCIYAYEAYAEPEGVTTQDIVNMAKHAAAGAQNPPP